MPTRKCRYEQCEAPAEVAERIGPIVIFKCDQNHHFDYPASELETKERTTTAIVGP